MEQSEEFSRARLPGRAPRRLALAGILGLALVMLFILLGASGCGPAAKTPTPRPVPRTRTPTPTMASAASATPSAEAPQPSSTPTATFAPEPGGRRLVLTPAPADVGWWSNSSSTDRHLGDSFLYGGFASNQVFVSAMAFDLKTITRGAAIREASLQIVGLRDDQFTPSDSGQWTVQFLAPAAGDELARMDFQALYNAPAALTLFPVLTAKDLAVNQVNTLSLDGPGRDWLAQEVISGTAKLVVRISGPTGAGGSLFAWDSGAGPATAHMPPQLFISLGAPPNTPPPLPTDWVVVATLTPTPANVLTAAVNKLTAVAQGTVEGPQATALVVTPTPITGPAVVAHTPTPANAATATANAIYATAIAIVTGTFTPVPTGAVTPIIVLPTPMPENVMTAAVQQMQATARAAKSGPATPLPFNALIATVTPGPLLITSTPPPANAATAVIYRAYATAVAMTTGTFTPIPYYAVTPTSPPPTPLVLYTDQMPPTPALAPTPTSGVTVPRALLGKIMFYSDRDGAERLFAYDPATGRLAYVTRDWPYTVALAKESTSPDAHFSVFVQNRTDTPERQPGLFVRDNQANTVRLLVNMHGTAYDPVWSPSGDRIAFVATDPGNDEIYAVNPDGGNLQRLTNNNWEWDKHPSWSPDGSQIVFWSNRGSGRRQLWVMNADGSNQRIIMPSSSNDWDPIWAK